MPKTELLALPKKKAKPPAPSTGVISQIVLHLEIINDPTRRSFGQGFLEEKDGRLDIIIMLNRHALIVSKALARSDDLSVRFLAGLQIAEALNYHRERPEVWALRKHLMRQCFGGKTGFHLFFSALAYKLLSTGALDAIQKMPIYGLSPRIGRYVILDWKVAK